MALARLVACSSTTRGLASTRSAKAMCSKVETSPGETEEVVRLSLASLYLMRTGRDASLGVQACWPWRTSLRFRSQRHLSFSSLSRMSLCLISMASTPSSAKFALAKSFLTRSHGMEDLTVHLMWTSLLRIVVSTRRSTTCPDLCQQRNPWSPQLCLHHNRNLSLRGLQR